MRLHAALTTFGSTAAACSAVCLWAGHTLLAACLQLLQEASLKSKVLGISEVFSNLIDSLILWFYDSMYSILLFYVPSILPDLRAVVQWDAYFWSRTQNKLWCNKTKQNKNKQTTTTTTKKTWGKEKVKYVYWSLSWNCPQLKEFAESMSVYLIACRIWSLFLCLLAGLHCRNSITDYEKSDLYVHVWSQLTCLVRRTIKPTSLDNSFELSAYKIPFCFSHFSAQKW